MSDLREQDFSRVFQLPEPELIAWAFGDHLDQDGLMELYYAAGGRMPVTPEELDQAMQLSPLLRDLLPPAMPVLFSPRFKSVRISDVLVIHPQFHPRTGGLSAYWTSLAWLYMHHNPSALFHSDIILNDSTWAQAQIFSLCNAVEESGIGHEAIQELVLSYAREQPHWDQVISVAATEHLRATMAQAAGLRGLRDAWLDVIRGVEAGRGYVVTTAEALQATAWVRRQPGLSAIHTLLEPLGVT